MAGRSNLELVDLIAEHLHGLGARVTVLPGPRDDARNLHAVVGPDETAGGVVLAAHTDVVAVDGQEWTVDPWALTLVESRLYGRGTADMKGFVAAALAAFAAVDPRRLRRPLHLALSCDEELGCRGVPSLLDFLKTLPARPAGVVVGEPTKMRVAVRHKGKVSSRVTVTGRASHSSLAPAGVNAVEYAARLIVALRSLGDELALQERDGAFGVPHATLSCGPIRGGVSVNIVPDHCCFDFELRTLPGQDASVTLGRARRLARDLEHEMRTVADEASIAIEPIAGYPALGEDDEASEPTAARAAAPSFAALACALAGHDGTTAVDFGTEAGLYRQALGVPVVVCGPGSMEQGHRPDEFLAVEQLDAAESFIRRLADRLTH